MTARLERHQVTVYLLAVLVAGVAGVRWPALDVLDPLVTPVLAAMLLATFLGVPLERLAAGLAHGRFLLALAVLNAAVVPLVVWALTRPLGAEPALVVGAALVLLTPCVDYVITFTRLGGGAADRLLAATPLLLLGQILWLPLWLPVVAGPGVVGDLPLRPFVEAFLVLVALPLGLAVATRHLARHRRWARCVQDTGASAVVLLTALTLAVVVASQTGTIGPRVTELLPLLPVYVGFAAVMALAGVGTARLLRLAPPEGRAALFSGVTRNSLVVLPLALALPAGLDLAPLAVVSQTVVELLLLVLLVPLLPRLLPARSRHRGAGSGPTPR